MTLDTNMLSWKKSRYVQSFKWAVDVLQFTNQVHCVWSQKWKSKRAEQKGEIIVYITSFNYSTSLYCGDGSHK